MEWLEVAKQLPLGHKRRIQHECGEGRDAIVSHGEAGYSFYCFRCGPVGFVPTGYMNLAEIQRIKELNKDATKTQPRNLPPDYTLAIPSKYLTWLLKAGISPARASSLGIGWSSRHHRILLPLYDAGGNLRYWQGRAVDKGQKPKYTNPPVSKSELLYWVHPKAGPTPQVVVTEDILSAIRVGKHVSAASLLGTKTSDYQAARLSEFERVVYWLDPDSAGVTGSIAGTRKLGLVTAVGSITSDVDPKNLSDRAIRSKLGLPPNHRYSL